MNNKNLLFHYTGSRILVIHFRENQGWVHNADALVNGERIDPDSIISMFVLDHLSIKSENAIADVAYHTRSIQFMKSFNIISEERLREIPYDEVYIKGDPKYSQRYTVEYSFRRAEFQQLVEENIVALHTDPGDFDIEKQSDNRINTFCHNFLGGRFGITRTNNLSKFERDLIRYDSGCLTSKRTYNHLVKEVGEYIEDRHTVYIPESEESINKREERETHADVIFSRHDDDGAIETEFADQIIRSICNKSDYRLYFASHQGQDRNGSLDFESSDEDRLIFSNVPSGNLKENNYKKLNFLYEQATDENFNQTRRYQTATTLLGLIQNLVDSASANSLEQIYAQSSYAHMRCAAENILHDSELSDFKSNFSSRFHGVGVPARRVDLVEDGFDKSDFERLLKIIDDAGEQLKLIAGDIRSLDEEGYRSFLFGIFNSRINGTLTRESETRRGQSDLRLANSSGGIVYIGEAKYWTKQNGGTKEHVEQPLDQISTYDQAQNFNSIVIFFDSENYQKKTINDVWQDCENKLEKYSEDFRLSDPRDSSNTSKIYQLELESGSKQRFVSLHVYDVTSRQYHESETDSEEAAT
jgi:hypothetical protein